MALAALFVCLQSASAGSLALSSLALVAMVAVVPLVIRLFASQILPHAPRSEFAFLMMVAVACGVGTHALGVYYLVGAFLVGMAAQRLRERLPAMTSERMLGAVESFASLFVPFYFFHSGAGLRSEEFGAAALGVGLAFSVSGISLRLLALWLHRRIVFGEDLRASLHVGLPMLPTLIFSLVIAQILRERFAIPPAVFGGIIVYAVINSLVPGLLFRKRLPELEDELLQELPLVPPAESQGSRSSGR